MQRGRGMSDRAASGALREEAGRSEEKRGPESRIRDAALTKALGEAWAEDEHAVLSDAIPKNDAGVRPPGPLFPWMPAILVFFLGLGLYRAWIELVFVTPTFLFPAAGVATHDMYDIVMSITLLACAASFKRLGPLFGKKWFYAVAVLLMLAATILLPASMFAPGLAVPLGWAAVVSGGVGTAFAILLWSELYGCLNPFRVALYYSGSLVVAAAVIYLSRSMDFAAFFAVAIALPLMSLGMAAAGFRSLPSERLPRSEPASFAIPWRVIFIMGVYAFAYGLKETDLYQSAFGPHSSFGVVFVSALIFLLVVVRGRRFQFSFIFRVALPLAVCAFLVVPSIGDWGAFVTDFCIGASYTAFSIFVMVVMANFCYRYGASAVLLFGIERGLRALVMLAGRHTDRFLHRSFEAATGDVVLSAIVIVAVVIATMMLLSDRDLAGRWGLALPGMGSVEDARAETARDELVDRCSQAAQRYGLSQREEEVLRLLAQHKKVGSIEQELFISNNTAKTHIRHIYRKLDVHSRDELVALLGEMR